MVWLNRLADEGSLRLHRAPGLHDSGLPHAAARLWQPWLRAAARGCGQCCCGQRRCGEVVPGRGGACNVERSTQRFPSSASLRLSSDAEPPSSRRLPPPFSSFRLAIYDTTPSTMGALPVIRRPLVWCARFNIWLTRYNISLPLPPSARSGPWQIRSLFAVCWRTYAFHMARKGCPLGPIGAQERPECCK